MSQMSRLILMRPVSARTRPLQPRGLQGSAVQGTCHFISEMVNDTVHPAGC